LIGQSEKAQTIFSNTASHLDLAEVSKKMLGKHFTLNLMTTFSNVRIELFEEAQEHAFKVIKLTNFMFNVF
jgi:hypothetical protein